MTDIGELVEYRQELGRRIDMLLLYVWQPLKERFPNVSEDTLLALWERVELSDTRARTAYITALVSETGSVLSEAAKLWIQQFSDTEPWKDDE